MDYNIFLDNHKSALLKKVYLGRAMLLKSHVEMDDPGSTLPFLACNLIPNVFS